MSIGKWNYVTKEYDDYNLPANASNYETDMSMIIACAECGEPVLFGKSYTSRRIHNQFGMGYSVCESCYEDESKLEKLHKVL